MTQSTENFIMRNENWCSRVCVALIAVFVGRYMGVETFHEATFVAAGAGILLVFAEDYIVGSAITLISMTLLCMLD